MDFPISGDGTAPSADSENGHSRQMTREQLRARIEQVMRQDPSLPNYQIAKRVGASPTTVKRVREANPDLQVQTGRVNTRGQVRPATYKPHPASPKPRREPLTDTARNAALKAVKASESWGRIIADDRFKKNRETIRDINLSNLRRARKNLDAAIAALEGDKGELGVLMWQQKPY